MFRMTILAAGGLLLAAAAGAGDAPAPAIAQPADGSTVSSPVSVVIVPPPMAPGMGHGAHLHLIIDAPLPEAGTSIPMDAQHIHLMHGETRTTVTLPPGQHTLQLIEGTMNHQVAPDAPHSDKVTFQVK